MRRRSLVAGSVAGARADFQTALTWSVRVRQAGPGIVPARPAGQFWPSRADSLPLASSDSQPDQASVLVVR